jgi:hypothetical protein
VKQAGQKEVYVTVPEADSHHQTRAVNYPGVARDFDSRAWPHGNDMAVVHHNRAVLDCRFGGRGINFGANQSQVSGTGRPARKKHRK